MDKFGCRIVIFITCAILTLGQAIFALGVSMSSFPVAFLGRGIFGLGGEVMEIAQTVIIVKWFTGHELSMAMGIRMTVLFLGGVLNDNIEPVIVDNSNLYTGVWVGFLVCLMSFVAMIVVITLDKRRETILKIEENKELLENEKFRFRDLVEFDSFFWILLLNSLTADLSAYCFMDIASGFFYDRFEYSESESSSIMSLTYCIAAFCCPIAGRITDKVGKRISALTLSALLVALFHIACILTPGTNKPIYPIFYLILLGVGISIHESVYWAVVPYIVKPKIFGSAYGVNYSISNTGSVVVPIIIGYLQDNSTEESGYFWPSILLTCLASTGIATGFIAYFKDIKRGKILQSSNPESVKLAYNKVQPGTDEEIEKSVN
jgi:MFS family permease